MNYREEIRQAIRCPQFGDRDYGEWGALNLKQRKLIKRLLDEIDLTDKFCKSILSEYSKKTDKLEELIKELKEENDDDCAAFIRLTYVIDRLEEIIDEQKGH